MNSNTEICIHTPLTPKPPRKNGNCFPKINTGPLAKLFIDHDKMAETNMVEPAMYLKDLTPVTSPSVAIVNAQIGWVKAATTIVLESSPGIIASGVPGRPPFRLKIVGANKPAAKVPQEARRPTPREYLLSLFTSCLDPALCPNVFLPAIRTCPAIDGASPRREKSRKMDSAT